MLCLLVGPPGGGKTLYAVDKIIKIANNEADEFKKIQYVYTNISGFNFNKFQDNKVVFDRFIFDNFYSHLKSLFALFLQNEDEDNLDDILQAYCKQHNLLNAYFIIDEANNFFDNQDKVKMWWLTYHRHLNHEILLITVNKSLINTQYRNIPEIFIKAQPRSKAISKNVLRYFNYTEYRMTQKFSTTEITINKSYFDLYKSGNTSNQKRVGIKYIILFFSFVFFFICVFSYFVYKLYFSNSMTQQDNKNNPVPLNQTQNNTKNATFSENQTQQTPINSYSQVNNSISVDLLEDNLKLFKFNCFEKFCYYKLDKKNTVEIPSNILKTYLLNIDIDKKFTEIKHNRLVIYVLVNENKFNFLDKGVKNENDKQNNVFSFPNVGLSK